MLWHKRRRFRTAPSAQGKPMPLTLSIRAAKPLETPADLLVLGVWAHAAKDAKGKDGKDAKEGKAGKATKDGAKSAGPAPLAEPLASLDLALGGGLAQLIEREEFTGKRDQTLSIPTLGRLPQGRVLVIGLGPRSGFGDGEARSFAAKAARSANGEKAKSLALVLPDGFEARLRAVSEGLELGAYRFTKYLTGDRKPKVTLEEVTLVMAKGGGAQGKRDLEIGQKIAAGVNVSRDLSNEPPNTLTPAALAAYAQEAGKTHGFQTTVFDFKEIKKRGMQLLQAVGQGSANEPRFVHMALVPKQKAKRRIVFVGKGITFDSGGLSIKPAAGMGEMKHDMSGAGNMVGLMVALAALKPKCEVHAILAAAENMPDGNAYRPGDVWGSLDGKSVEIINTDAEGRLILADALAYARTLEPDLLVDNATLTGAMVVALGNTCSGWYANTEDAAKQFEGAVKASGESFWRMPLLEELKDQLKSDVADLKHTGDRWAGSITAALFLREFIGETKNWVHCDIAGPAMSDRAAGWSGKGATGHAVLTFVSLVERAAAKS
jgi:leucyl aminopeptidase